MKKNNQLSDFQNQWQDKFNELCYTVFMKTDAGTKLLQHMENLYFRSPVAMPGQDKSWAYFNEGRNDLIRSFSNACQLYMSKNLKEQSGQIVKERK
jgi:hypothetical protein